MPTADPPSSPSVVMTILLPVCVTLLASVAEELTRVHGKGLLMRQEGAYLVIFKP